MTRTPSSVSVTVRIYVSLFVAGVWHDSAELSTMAGSAAVGSWPEVIALMRVTGLAAGHLTPDRSARGLRVLARRDDPSAALLALYEWRRESSGEWVPAFGWTAGESTSAERSDVSGCSL